MTKIQTTRYDVAEHLRTQEEMAAYLEACLEEADGDAAFVAKALGDKRGIARYGFTLPMDETLALVSLDISGRPFLVYDGGGMAPMIGGFDTELTEEFLRAFAFNAGITLHVKVLYGTNSHHKVEAIFKALGHALRIATEKDPRVDGVPSTKGTLQG